MRAALCHNPRRVYPEPPGLYAREWVSFCYFVTVFCFVLFTPQRIPSSASSPAQSGKPVAFLQHGLEDSAATWVVNLANESLAFILANAGFDVWLGNNRGNIYSDRNTKYTYKQKEFWEWSVDQLAQFDAPTMIDYVLNATGQPRLSWVGHSQGTMQMFFALATQRAAMASKVARLIFLCCVVLTVCLTPFCS